MWVSEALSMSRMILGDESESVWSDEQIVSALNLANKRIMTRIVSENPDQYLISYEDYMSLALADADVAPLSMDANTGRLSLWGEMHGAMTTEGHTADADYAKFSTNPIKVVRLFYSTNSDLKDRIEIPLVPFDSLDERTETQVLEYEVLSRTAHGRRVYKASYSAGTTILHVRPIPAQKMYFKIYWAEAGVYHFHTSGALTVHAEQRLLTPFVFGVQSSEKHKSFSLSNTAKSEAVVFDACWTLSFKDQSMREACATERERILATQSTPMSPNEAY